MRYRVIRKRFKVQTRTLQANADPHHGQFRKMWRLSSDSVACRLATHTKQLLANSRADILLDSIILTDRKVREPGNGARACSKFCDTFTWIILQSDWSRQISCGGSQRFECPKVPRLFSHPWKSLGTRLYRVSDPFSADRYCRTRWRVARA